MPDTVGQSGQKALSPPYTAFQSVKTLLATCKEHSVPSRIDRTVLNNFSGAVASQLLTALRFLSLTDDAGIPTGAMHDLVEAYGTDSFAAKLADTLRMAYAPLFELNLQTATPGQFNEKFKDAYPSEGETLRKGITFFLNAARDAQVPISGYIMKNKKPRSAPTKRRAPKVNGANKVPAESVRSEGGATPPAPHQGSQSLSGTRQPSPSEVLLQHFDPASMDDDQQEAVWTLLKFFKSKGL